MNFKYKNFSSSRRFGVELELSNNLTKRKIGNIVSRYEKITAKNKLVCVTPGKEGWAQTNDNDYWHVKFDRSCGPLGTNDHGWEVASYIGSGIEDVFHISNLADYLKKNKSETNKNCGLHIHVEVEDFTTTKMSVLLARWMKIENTLMNMCDSSRKNNVYCKSIRQLYFRKKSKSLIPYNSKKIDNVWDVLSPYDLGVHENTSKRYSLNLVGFANALIDSYKKRNTIELRLPECVLDSKHISSWIFIIINFVESSLNAKAPKDLEELDIQGLYDFIGISDPDSFCIFEKEIFELKEWIVKTNVEKNMSFVEQNVQKLLNCTNI